MKRGLLFRTAQAAAGLALFSFGVYLTIQANIGLAPWDCLSMGLSYHLPITYGTAAILISCVIVVIDLLLRERIGIGTLLDAAICGLSVDFFSALKLVPAQSGLLSGIPLMVAGMFVMSFGQYVYMRAGLCCGPRDSLLVGVGRRLKRMPIGLVNILILCAALAAGWALGGKVGVGTLVSALGIGVTMQITFRLLRFEPRDVAHEGLFQSAASLRKPVSGCGG